MIVMLVCLFLFPPLFFSLLPVVSIKAILTRTGAGSKIEEVPLNVGETHECIGDTGWPEWIKKMYKNVCLKHQCYLFKLDRLCSSRFKL